MDSWTHALTTHLAIMKTGILCLRGSSVDRQETCLALSVSVFLSARLSFRSSSVISLDFLHPTTAASYDHLIIDAVGS